MFGKAGQVVSVVKRVLKHHNVEADEFVSWLATNKRAVAQLEQLVGVFLEDAGARSVLVDYDSPLPEAIERSRLKLWDNTFVEKYFPRLAHERGKVVVECKPLCFPCALPTAGVIKDMNRRGFRPGTLRELVAYSTDNYRRGVFNYFLSAVGTVHIDLRGKLCPCVVTPERRRELVLGRYDTHDNPSNAADPSATCWYLAVRKKRWYQFFARHS